jgi:large subunit ribosomal protein L17
MKWSVLLLVLAAGVAAFWYSRRANSRSALGGGGSDAYRLQASAGNDRPQGPVAASSAPAHRPGQSSILQEAADTASGKRYEEAADQIEAKAAALAEARKEAERSAARLSGQADEALANVQAAATMKSGSVPGDGTHDCPPDYPVKGNQSSRLYHLPSSPNYAATIPEFCFADAEAAEAAGYSAPKR